MNFQNNSAQNIRPQEVSMSNITADSRSEIASANRTIYDEKEEAT